jgi:hypothetical protein
VFSLMNEEVLIKTRTLTLTHPLFTPKPKGVFSLRCSSPNASDGPLMASLIAC